MSDFILSFTIDGKHYSYDNRTLPKDITLLEFIREYAKLYGTKFMCLEGVCGSCTVLIKGNNLNSGRPLEYSANSCLILLNTINNMEVTTVQGIGNRRTGYHPIQTRLAQLNGSQCGYCSPGFVMNMYGLVKGSGGKLSSQEIENSFGGNICRCTGYRSILDSMKSFSSDSEFYKDNIQDIEDLPEKTCSLDCDISEKGCKEFKVVQNIKESVEIDDKTWYFPTKLAELYSIFQKITDNQKYILVAGGTAHGAYRRPNDIKVYIDLNKVEELHVNKINDNLVTIGANTSITKTMEILLQIARKPGFEYCLEIYNLYDLVANKQVRNVGTLAGNLMTKQQYNDFPSDIFTTLETVAAQLYITDRDGKSILVSLLDFLRTNMLKRVLVNITLKPYSPAFFYFRSYKILPIAQNSKAIINAGFLIQVDNTKSPNPIVRLARICYGGIASNFVHASQTEKYLTGKNLFKNQGITEALLPELKTDWVLPDTSPEYRKLLACGLFYRFLLSITPRSNISQANQSAISLLQRPLSSGIQTYDTKPLNYPLTQAVAKLDGVVQASGEAQYSNDLIAFPNEIFAAFVTATSVNSVLVQINPTEALKVPGVIAFFSAKDIPGKNSFVNTDYFALYIVEEPIFLNLNAKVQFYDQPIGIIVAESTKIAEMAAKLVKVLYSRVNKKPVASTIKRKFELEPEREVVKDFKPKQLTPLSAENMFTFNGKPISPQNLDNKTESVPHNSSSQYCDIASAGLKLEDFSFDDIEADLNDFSGYLYLGGQYHFTMEPHTTICVPNEDGLFVYSSTQWMEGTQVTIARMLKLPQNSVQLQVRRVGGGYGGKISRNCQISCATALASYLLNRPVRFVMTIEYMMRCLGKRTGLKSSYHATVDKTGKITHIECSYFSDCGATINENTIDIIINRIVNNCYQASIVNWKFVGIPEITDAPSNTWMRAPGSIEGISMIENIMEHAARVVNIDPVDVRMLHIANDNPMKKLLPDFIKSVGYRERKESMKNFNKTNRWIKRGIGISIMQYNILYFFSLPVTVVIYEDDGSVGITHGGIEVGQGLNTKVVQAAAYVLKVPLDKIKILSSNSVTGANAFATGGSVTSESICFATKKACETLLKRLLPVKQSLTSPTWQQIIKTAHMRSISLIANDQSSMQELKFYNVPGLACTEIELDILTGNHIIKRVDILEDAGESLNPLIDIGQIEGAFIQGIGYFTCEKLVYDNQTGELVTNRTWTYKVPQCKDIPVDFRVNLLKNSTNPAGVLGSKATGEPAICLSISVLFALRMALESARIDSGVKEIWFHMGAPFTTEDAVINSGTKIDMFKL